MADSSMPSATAAAAEQVRQAARALGFVSVGFAPVERYAGAAEALEQWTGHGHHGEMSYLAEGLDRADPRSLLAEAKTVVVVALPYGPRRPAGTIALRRSADGPATEPVLRGQVAGYALGDDYHGVFKEKLIELAEACTIVLGRPVLCRACVDTAPLLEREAARRAGLGFIGKNTMLITPRSGSRLLLGELLVDVVFPADSPIDTGCGRCRACLDACPTSAFVGPYVLDARRCISYLTIELTGPIPKELRTGIGTRVFGCDVCQDVCPYNGSAHAPEPAPQFEARPALDGPDLIALLELRASAYRKLVGGTALRRVSRARLARNAAVALGNLGEPKAVPALARALRSDANALVRAHAAWALGRIGGEEAVAALRQSAATDPDETVRREAVEALDGRTLVR